MEIVFSSYELLPFLYILKTVGLFAPSFIISNLVINSLTIALLELTMSTPIFGFDFI